MSTTINQNYPNKPAPVPNPEPGQEPREWSRLACGTNDIPTPIQHPEGILRESVLLDKSLGGIGVRVAQSDWFHLGDDVTVTFFNAPVRAIVRQKSQLPDGTWRLGLQWKDNIFD